jgi:hypothetical protein
VKIMLRVGAAGLTLSGGDGYSSRSGESLREPREDAEVGVQRDPRESANAERRQSVLVLEPSELALDNGRRPR